MLKSSIEVKFYDAAVEGGYRAPKPLQNPLNVADAVHPDSKQASIRHASQEGQCGRVGQGQDDA